ncbi:sulfatase [Butyrivibrio sp. MC2013]|uniref:sulfatase n=1 Tax=Butyrivibrio sp. MC2013 TaxID=1280686 RepID=UPI000421C88F|nr:sulfatase [Butyrivibrio sp. MC2013]
MKAIMLLFDSLNRRFLPNYGCDFTILPNFQRLGERTTIFDNFYGGSMPCMPARRELHTGRYNFLHTGWSPLQPYDDSLISRLSRAGIYTHISTDHYHYWEVGGSGYLGCYDSCDMIRGQEGDGWKGQVRKPDIPKCAYDKSGPLWIHDWINRQFLTKEEDMPQVRTFSCGLDFIRRNYHDDNWFLQIESFDPHEPFFTQQHYKDLYPHDYHGDHFDWPDYGVNHCTPEETEHARMEYAALMSMCDHYLGQLLDLMDAEDMWKDTMLIVNTDHGYMLGEKEWMGKNICPQYDELIHTPFFIHDPRSPHPGVRRHSLAQTVDIPATIADYFGIEGPRHMDGRSLTPVIREDVPVRDGALFGIFGGHINVTDGEHVYMRAPVNEDNQPLRDYTLMPMHMSSSYSPDEFKGAELCRDFSFTEGFPLMKLTPGTDDRAYRQGSRLYDLTTDPEELHPLEDEELEQKMTGLMIELMKANEAPKEQYIRVGLTTADD